MNVRDLGGLSTAHGGPTRWGALVRSDHPGKLTASGWQSLLDHGVRTILQLGTHGLVERPQPDASPRPANITTQRIDIEDATDAEFHERWVKTELWTTPLFFADCLHRWPERHAKVVAAFANAAPGGVLVHCRRGFDRTGITTLLLLALAGVSREDILADYALSEATVPEEERRALRDLLAKNGAALGDGIFAALDGLDVRAYLRRGGLDEALIDAARARLVGEDAPE